MFIFTSTILRLGLEVWERAGYKNKEEYTWISFCTGICLARIPK